MREGAMSVCFGIVLGQRNEGEEGKVNSKEKGK